VLQGRLSRPDSIQNLQLEQMHAPGIGPDHFKAQIIDGQALAFLRHVFEFVHDEAADGVVFVCRQMPSIGVSALTMYSFSLRCRM